jgi:hypothetical protein
LDLRCERRDLFLLLRDHITIFQAELISQIHVRKRLVRAAEVSTRMRASRPGE